MQKTGRWLTIIVALLIAQPALAGNIGFVDAERVVATVEEGKAELQQLEVWAGGERQRLEQLSGRVNEVRQQIAAQSRSASPDVVEGLRNEELAARRAFEDAKRDFDRRLEKRQTDLVAKIVTKVGTVAADYADANGLDAVFVLRPQLLIYLSPSADLTDEIIQLYNERFPVGASG